MTPDNQDTLFVLLPEKRRRHEIQERIPLCDVILFQFFNQIQPVSCLFCEIFFRGFCRVADLARLPAGLQNNARVMKWLWWPICELWELVFSGNHLGKFFSLANEMEVVSIHHNFGGARSGVVI